MSVIDSQAYLRIVSDETGWIVEETADRLQKGRRRQAVRDPVIEGQTERDDLALGQLALMPSHSVTNPADAQDPGFRGVDDRSERVHTIRAKVRNCEAGSGNVVEVEPAGTRRARQGLVVLSK